MNKRLLNYFLFLLTIHITGVCMLSAFRMIQLIILSEHATGCSFAMFSKSCLLGVWFDNTVGCYILLLPLLVICLELMFNKSWSYVDRGLIGYLIGFYTLAFALSAGNIPFFQYFLQNINMETFSRMNEDGGMAVRMILEDPSYYMYIFLFLLAAFVWGNMVVRLRRKFLSSPEIQAVSAVGAWRWKVGGLCLLMLIACIVGIRGSVNRYPIKLRFASFCDNVFLNQTAISPSFNFLKSFASWQKDQIHWLDNEKALTLAKHNLFVTDTISDQPIARYIYNGKQPWEANVVLVFMESMSADLMTRYGNKKKLTPNLDRLSEESLYFDNFFSCGEHTNQGVFCTLTSYPAVFTGTIMYDHKPFSSSLGNILKEKGYRTLFFIPHDRSYDNLYPFLKMNGFSSIYGQDDYDRDSIVNTWGVADKYLYSYALKKIDELPKEQPFLASILTVSNHPPYIIPEEFRDETLSKEEQIVRYADDAIGEFLKKARKKEWYDRTIFVFVADHGKGNLPSNTEIPVSYHHIPLIIYSPLIEKKINTSLGCQLDITPTLLGLLRINYIRNSFGLDLLQEERTCVYFTADNKLGCMDNQHFYVYNKEQNIDRLYKRKGWNFQNADPATDSLALKRLKEYGFAMFQTSLFLRNKGKI